MTSPTRLVYTRSDLTRIGEIPVRPSRSLRRTLWFRGILRKGSKCVTHQPVTRPLAQRSAHQMLGHVMTEKNVRLESKLPVTNVNKWRMSWWNTLCCISSSALLGMRGSTEAPLGLFRMIIKTRNYLFIFSWIHVLAEFSSRGQSAYPQSKDANVPNSGERGSEMSCAKSEERSYTSFTEEATTKLPQFQNLPFVSPVLTENEM